MCDVVASGHPNHRVWLSEPTRIVFPPMMATRTGSRPLRIDLGILNAFLHCATSCVLTLCNLTCNYIVRSYPRHSRGMHPLTTASSYNALGSMLHCAHRWGAALVRRPRAVSQPLIEHRLAHDRVPPRRPDARSWPPCMTHACMTQHRPPLPLATACCAFTGAKRDAVGRGRARRGSDPGMFRLGLCC